VRSASLQDGAGYFGTPIEAMARDAASRGDSIEAENLYQHAEHYFRVMREQQD